MSLPVEIYRATEVPALRMREATDADLELTYAITESAMRSAVEETWGRWDAAEQREKHRTNFTPESHRIILVQESVAGFVAVEDLPTHIWLVKLYLLAPCRNRGIGSRVLASVLQRATALGKPVTLRVLKVNKRAQALYARHGFRVAEEGAERLHMVWDAVPTRQAQDP